MITLLNFTGQITQLLIIFFCVLSFASLVFYIFKKLKPGIFAQNLVDRTNSWWIIYFFYILTFGINYETTLVGLLFVSFVAHRELISNLKFPLHSRRLILWSYLAIPIQYYFIYRGYFLLFLLFIPVLMFFLLVIRTILDDNTRDYLRIISHLHLSLMISTYAISHIAYMAQFPTIEAEKNIYQAIIFFIIFVTSLNDIFQFISGKIFKGKKLTPLISPNKTISGFVGGVLGSALFAYSLRDIMPLSATQTIIAGCVISVFGLLGDLNISAIKRNLNIKDMSNFIPGHGGVLDRIDSLSFTSVAYFYLLYYWIYQ